MKTEKIVSNYTRVRVGSDECSECVSGVEVGVYFDTYRLTETILSRSTNKKGETVTNVTDESEKIESDFFCAVCAESIPMTFKAI